MTTTAETTAISSDVTGARVCHCRHTLRLHGNDFACVRCDCTAMEPVYTSADVIHLTGCTYRQLDWWARTGHLPDTAKGSGSQRWFAATELDLVRNVVALLDFGIKLERAFEIARALSEQDEYRLVVGDIWQLRITAIDPSDQVAKPEDPTTERTPE